jgi:hypothetical protein
LGTNVSFSNTYPSSPSAHPFSPSGIDKTVGNEQKAYRRGEKGGAKCTNYLNYLPRQRTKIEEGMRGKQTIARPGFF